MAILAEISVSAGAYQSGGVTVASTATIQPRLNPQTTNGIWSVRWDIYEAPPSATCPAGWTDNGDGTFYFIAGAATSLMPPLIALTGTPWGKWLLRATANGGVIGGVVDLAAAVDEATAWSVESPGGTEDVAALEGTQFNANGALGVIKEALRGPMFVYEDAPDLIRTAYDLKITDISLPADGGEAWQTLWTLTRATICPYGLAVRITVDITLQDAYGALQNTKDQVAMVGSYRRHDDWEDTVTNCDNGTTARGTGAIEANWTLDLPAANANTGAGLLYMRIRRGSGGTAGNVYVEARLHATSARRITAELYLGTPA